MTKKVLFTVSVALFAVALTAAVAIDTTAAAADDPPAFAITLDQLKALNPAVAVNYGQISPCVPHMGKHYGAVVDGMPANAPSVVLSVDPVDQRVTAMEIIVPSEMPWQPWFDQAEGEPLELAPGMKFWTQHVFLVDHGSINECPPPGE